MITRGADDPTASERAAQAEADRLDAAGDPEAADELMARWYRVHAPDLIQE